MGFGQYVEMDLTISPEKAQEYAEIISSYMATYVGELRRLVLVEDMIDSIKFGIFLWVMTYIGAWFNGMGPDPWSRFYVLSSQDLRSLPGANRCLFGSCTGSSQGNHGPDSRQDPDRQKKISNSFTINTRKISPKKMARNNRTKIPARQGN